MRSKHQTTSQTEMLFITAHFNISVQRRLDNVRGKIDNREGIKVRGHKIDVIWFADDIVVLAESKKQLQHEYQ